MPKRNLPRRFKELKKTKQSAVDLNWDNNIESSDDEGSNDNDKRHQEPSSESEEELTVEQKRKKIAQEYLANMTTNVDTSDSDISDDDDILPNESEKMFEKLTRARLKSEGKYFSNISANIGTYVNEIPNLEQSVLGGHQHAVTCVALSPDECTAYSGSKDNSIIRWDTETGARTFIRHKWNRKTHKGTQSHEGEVLSVAISSDTRYLASGGRDNLIRIYDTRLSGEGSEVQSFCGHRDAVTSLTFQKDTYSLFSGSADRCIKHWDLNEMGYLETLFGHQDTVTSLDCWIRDRPISCSSDRSVRMWNVADDSHLVFRGHKASIDNVQYLSLESFITSGQDGSLCLWKNSQKKPTVQVNFAHGCENGSREGRWISAMASCKMTDFVATGSHDGHLRLWEADSENRTLNPTASIAVDGFINAIALSKRVIVVGVGNEHRLGRWWSLSKVRNCVKIVKLPDCNEHKGVEYSESCVTSSDVDDFDDFSSDNASTSLISSP